LANKDRAIALTPAMRRFILHWGDMGTRWGINRTVAQIHALLYIVPRAISAEEIASTLSIARSNVSTSLRELQGWGIVRPTHVLGDRRDYFESLKDVWEMFQLILEERKRREMDPTLSVLREEVAQLERSHAPADLYARQRLKDMLEFFETMASAYTEMRSVSIRDVRMLLRLRGGARRLLKLATPR
jgi:DNA-binding transcriptional regulator GbsR (MarR family)